MRMLIRIVFVIFIAKGIDCLGKVCDNCCDCFKEEDENITAESLISNAWYNAKKNKSVLMIFKKEDDNDNIFTSKDNKYKISIESDEEGNHKIAYQDESEQELKLEEKKYALFEIKTNTNKTVYLYCSDVESKSYGGIFGVRPHVSISVIACDTEKVTNMGRMFSGCSSLNNLDISNFNTTEVTNMAYMFHNCSSLTDLDLQNFNTEKVTNMNSMFRECSSLTKLNFGENFDTKKVTDMMCMFWRCSSLTDLDLQNFNTEKVTNMNSMFRECSSLTELNFGDNFDTKNVTNMGSIFDGCSLPQETQDKILGKNK